MHTLSVNTPGMDGVIVHVKVESAVGNCGNVKVFGVDSAIKLDCRDDTPSTEANEGRQIMEDLNVVYRC